MDIATEYKLSNLLYLQCKFFLSNHHLGSELKNSTNNRTATLLHHQAHPSTTAATSTSISTSTTLVGPTSFTIPIEVFDTLKKTQVYKFQHSFKCQFLHPSHIFLKYLGCADNSDVTIELPISSRSTIATDDTKVKDILANSNSSQSLVFRIPAHKYILKSNSSYFTAMFSSEWTESQE